MLSVPLDLSRDLPSPLKGPPRPRPDGRADNELRPITFERDLTRSAAGSVLVSFGGTRVLCTASIDESVPLRLAYPYRTEFSFLPEMGTGRLLAVKRARFLRGDPEDAVAGAFNPRKFVTRWHLSWLEAVNGPLVMP